MKKLKPGDRVAVFGSAGPHPTMPGFPLFLRGDEGVVDVVYETLGDVVVKLDAYDEPVEVHTRQCKQLTASVPQYLYAAYEEGTLYPTEQALFECEGADWVEEVLKLKVVKRKKVISK